MKSNTESRHEIGEAYVVCVECGARLWSEDGDKDIESLCPYRTSDGSCRTNSERYDNELYW